MKKIFKYSLAALTAVFGLMACSDDDNYSPGQWDANSGYYDVSFPQTSVSEELDPTDATETTLTIQRKNTSGDATVPFEIVTNTDDVFSVGEAHFASGDSIANFKVTFPKAEIGKTYTLRLKVTDPQFVSSYSSNTVLTYNVARAKWNLLGVGTIEENYYIGEAGEVEIYQKDSEPNVFRIAHPLDMMLAKAKTRDYWAAEEFNGNEPAELTITVRDDDILLWDDFSSGCTNLTYGAEVLICHPSGFSSTADESNWTFNRVLSWQDDGVTPGQLQLAPWYYMNGVGGWNYSQEPGMIVITFPGYTPPYTPDLTSADDFTWEEFFEGVFTSAQLGTKGNAKLYKGKCIATINDADKIFAETYGTPYCVASPYAEGHNLYFTVDKDNNIKLPEGCELQNTGLTAVGQEVFAKINVGTSSLVGNRLELDITFVNEEGTLTYGKAVEVLERIPWKQLGTGVYTYGEFLLNESATQEGLIVKQREDIPSFIAVEDYLAVVGVEEGLLTFDWDQTTNKCKVHEQPIGIDYPGYGPIYVMEAGEYNGEYSSGGSYYDPATTTFHLDVIYFVEGGTFGYGYETLQVTFDAAAKAYKVKKVKNLFNPSALRLQRSASPISKRLTPKPYSVRSLKLGSTEPLMR